MRNRVLFLLLTLSIFSVLIMACTNLKSSAPVPAPYAEMYRERMLEFLHIYPEEFKLSQHIIMKANGKEYDFLGYLVVKRKKGFRAIAFGEMGGKIFDFIERDRIREIATKPEAMPSRPILDGVMGDINHLYDTGQFEDAYPSMEDGNKLSLVLKNMDNRSYEFVFSKEGILTASMEKAEGKLVRKATYDDYRLYPGCGKPLPSKITLVNYRWHYELKIELLRMNEGQVDEQILLNNKKE